MSKHTFRLELSQSDLDQLTALCHDFYVPIPKAGVIRLAIHELARMRGLAGS